VYKKVSHPGGIFEEELVMSEDATQQLLIARVDQLISLVGVINENLQQVNTRLEKVGTQQGEMSARLHNLETQQGEMSARLHNLETIVDQRLYDTRPLWESVLSQIAELDKKIDTRVEELRAETSSGFRAVDRKIGALSKNLIDMTAEIQDLREMVEKIEAQPD
jgi:archaellum component FlaC